MVKVSLISWDKNYDISLPEAGIFPIAQQLICQWEITETELKCSNPQFKWMITEKSDFVGLVNFWLEYTRIWSNAASNALIATAKKFSNAVIINCNFQKTNNREVFTPMDIPIKEYSLCLKKVHNVGITFKKRTNSILNFITAIHGKFMPEFQDGYFSMGSKRFILVIQGDLYEIEKYFLQKQTGNLFAKPKCLTKENPSINIAPVLKQDKTIFS